MLCLLNLCNNYYYVISNVTIVHPVIIMLYIETSSEEVVANVEQPGIYI